MDDDRKPPDDAPPPFTWRDVEAHWSRVAANRRYPDANERFDATHRQRFEISLPHLALGGGGRLLHLWSRQGEAVPLIREAWPDCEVVHAEISRVMLSQSRIAYPNERHVAVDLIRLPFASASFDAILSLETLEHAPRPEALLEEFHRVLRPGARLVLTCPAPMAELATFVADTFLGNHGEGPHRFPSTRWVFRTLARCGFELEGHRATLFVPRELGALGRWTNELCERFLQWHPACEFGLRQLYVARRPVSARASREPVPCAARP